MDNRETNSAHGAANITMSVGERRVVSNSANKAVSTSNGAAHAAAGMSRRTFLSGFAAVALMGVSAAFLSACGVQRTASSPSASASSANETLSDGAASGTGNAGKTLVAYYSAQGHTKTAAEALADELGADIFVITPAKSYSTKDLDFNDETSRVSKEHEDPTLIDDALAQNAPDNFAEYETVFIGYPIWWAEAAWAMRAFARENDFTNKTVIPFCTSYSSGIGSSGANLGKLAGTGNWQEGMRFDQEVDEEEVRTWAQSL